MIPLENKTETGFLYWARLRFDLISLSPNSKFQVARSIVRIFFSLVLFFPALSESKEKICLNMIVKNESQVIKRCLDSIKPIIDYWVIVDTGSSDGTQKIIKDQMKGIPGELHERPWKNFGYNRTEALELAKEKGDYLLFMDADDFLEFENGFQLPTLTHDIYDMHLEYKGEGCIRPQMVRADLPWKWVGIIHEYIDCDQSVTREILPKVKYAIGTGGSRSQNPQKYLKDAELLLEILKEDPGNTRYVFFLADSYCAAGENAKALEWHQKRVNMGGDGEDVFWSKFQIAKMLQALKMESSILIESYKDAHYFRPSRVEPVFHLCELYNSLGRYDEAYQLLKARESLPKRPLRDMIFFLEWIEEFGLLFQLSICAYYTGHYQEALDACDQLLAIPDLPETWRKETEINRTFPLAMLQNNQ